MFKLKVDGQKIQNKRGRSSINVSSESRQSRIFKTKMDCASNLKQNMKVDGHLWHKSTLSVKTRLVHLNKSGLSCVHSHPLGPFIQLNVSNFFSKIFRQQFLRKMTFSNNWIVFPFSKAFKNFDCLKVFKNRIKELESMR